MKKEYDFSKGSGGAVLTAPPGKTRVTIRLDDDILDWFRQQVDDAGGGNYQTLINQALRTVHAPQAGAVGSNSAASNSRRNPQGCLVRLVSGRRPSSLSSPNQIPAGLRGRLSAFPDNRQQHA